MYLFDTNAVIYFVQKEQEATLRLSPIFAANEPLFIATISVAEFFSPGILPDEERHGIEGILNVLITIPLDIGLARHAGCLRSAYNMKLADSIIAASALLMNSTILTRNVRDFKRVPNLAIQPI